MKDGTAGYQRKVLDLFREFQKTPGCVYTVPVYHDDDCMICFGGDCDCEVELGEIILITPGSVLH